jgi:cell division protein FtsW (lipid II flippase)
LILRDTHQRVLLRRLERVLIAFFLLAALSLLVVYFADPSIYTKTLTLESTTTDRYSLPATLFLVGILVFITVLMVGVMRHWRWLFWLILIAFGFSILQIPATILQLTGVIPDSFPVWYSLYRMGVALFQAVIAVWMIYIYQHYGVWAMGKKKKT